MCFTSNFKCLRDLLRLIDRTSPPHFYWHLDVLEGWVMVLGGSLFIYNVLKGVRMYYFLNEDLFFRNAKS